MAHGYLRDWDEGWDREDERERGSDRDRHDRDNDRDHRFMLDERDREHGRGFFERMGDEARDRFRDDDRERQSDHSFGESSRGSADWERAPRNFSNRQDDHYRSWRDRHMESLDRDYADYCREREQQFHRDFNDWRGRKYGNPQPLRTGMTQAGILHDPSGMSEAAEDSAPLSASAPDPTADATLGTNSSGGPRSRGRG